MMESPVFKDEEFLSKKQKEKILKNWFRFIKSGFKKDNFTDVLYQHLHLDCGLIAHYDRITFYNEYFVDPEDTLRFMSYFESDCPTSCMLFKDDLTSVMMQELEKLKPTILKELHKKNTYKKELELELARRNLQESQQQI